MVGQFFTPPQVVQAAYRFARVRRGQRIVDPSCGDGAFLRGAPAGCTVQGCEIDEALRPAWPEAAADGRVLVGDALTVLQPQWGRFDVAVGNPPFSAQAQLERRPDVLAAYELGAGRRALCLEVLFLELFLKLVKPRGRIAIILPDGPLGNRPFEYVRRWLLERAHVELIVSLPRKTFSATAAKTNLLIARRRPAGAPPVREPTWLSMCRGLEDLPLVQPGEVTLGAGGRAVVLEADSDWRPEAHEVPTVSGGADGVRLGDCFALRTGFARYAGDRRLFAEPAADRLLLLRAKNLSPAGGLRTEQDAAFITVGGPMYREASRVQPGEIVFVRVGVGCYGRTALVPAGLTAQADDWIHILTPQRPVDAPGLVSWLNGDEGRAAVRRLSKGVGTLSVSKGSLAELRIPARFVG